MLEDSDNESLFSGDEINSDVELETTESEDEADDEEPTPSTSNAKHRTGDKRKRATATIECDSGWNKTVNASDLAFSPADTVGVRNVNHLNEESASLDFLSLFWNDEIWQKLADMTNLRATQTLAIKPHDYYARKWTEVSVEEMKAFFGVRMYTEGSVIKRRYEHYFTDKPGFLFSTPGYRKVFPRDRFMAIWKFLHVVHESNPELDKSDKVYKVRPVLNDIATKFQHFYVPSQDMSLDEGMIPAKNRLRIKQYIKSKPVKWGIKTFLLCESDTGYIYNFEVYTGKSDGLYVSEIGESGSVVARLTAVIENKNYHVYMDQFYNSPALCTYLKSKGLGACGTIQTNRKQFPKELIRKKSQLQHGESDFLCRDDVGIVVCCDRSPIYFVSTFHDPCQMTTITRKNKNGSIEQLNCPQLMSDYTRNMGGCDLNDQMTKIYRTCKHYRWPRRLMIKSVLWCLYNAYVIEKKIKPTDLEAGE